MLYNYRNPLPTLSSGRVGFPGGAFPPASRIPHPLGLVRFPRGLLPLALQFQEPAAYPAIRESGVPRDILTVVRLPLAVRVHLVEVCRRGGGVVLFGFPRGIPPPAFDIFRKPLPVPAGREVGFPGALSLSHCGQSAALTLAPVTPCRRYRHRVRWLHLRSALPWEGGGFLRSSVPVFLWALSSSTGVENA